MLISTAKLTTATQLLTSSDDNADTYSLENTPQKEVGAGAARAYDPEAGSLAGLTHSTLQAENRGGSVADQAPQSSANVTMGTPN